jgi:hypothetical protein
MSPALVEGKDREILACEGALRVLWKCAQANSGGIERREIFQVPMSDKIDYVKYI